MPFFKVVFGNWLCVELYVEVGDPDGVKAALLQENHFLVEAFSIEAAREYAKDFEGMGTYSDEGLSELQSVDPASPEEIAGLGRGIGKLSIYEGYLANHLSGERYNAHFIRAIELGIGL